MDWKIYSCRDLKQSKGRTKCITKACDFNIYLFMTSHLWLGQLGIHIWQSSPFQILQKKFLGHQTGATMLDF